MDASLRFLCPRDHDRTCEIVRKTGYTLEKKFVSSVQMIKIVKHAGKYLELLEKIERAAAKHGGYNFILKNIPDKGVYSETGEETKIGFSEMRDTLKQFGKIQQWQPPMEFIRGTIYVQFDDPTVCHRLVNNMQMGNNILSSNVVA